MLEENDESSKPLVIEEIPKPTPGTGEIVGRVETTGLMPFGLHAARCDWPVKSKFPLIAGHEGLGIVKEIGKDMTEVNEEDRVAGDTNVFAESTKERFLSS